MNFLPNYLLYAFLLSFLKAGDLQVQPCQDQDRDIFQVSTYKFPPTLTPGENASFYLEGFTKFRKFYKVNN
jgi:hypothetical protein